MRVPDILVLIIFEQLLGRGLFIGAMHHLSCNSRVTVERGLLNAPISSRQRALCSDPCAVPACTHACALCMPCAYTHGLESENTR